MHSAIFQLSRLLTWLMVLVGAFALEGQSQAPDNQNVQPSTPSVAPAPPGPAPPIAPIAPATGTSTAAGIEAKVRSSPEFAQARIPLSPTPPPNPLQTEVRPVGGIYVLDWLNGSATPDTIQESGPQTLFVVNVNDVLYTYQFNVNEIKGADDDLAALKSAISSLTDTFGKNAAAQHVEGCTPIADTKTTFDSLSTSFQSIFPKQENGKYKSIALADTLSAWTKFRADFNGFEIKVNQIQKDLTNCVKDDTLAKQAEDLISGFRDLQEKVKKVQARIDSNHAVSLPYGLNRTSDYDVTVTEKYQVTPTEATPVTFHLKRGFSTLTLSGGFLLTEIQARSYSSAAVPISGGTATQNELSVSNLNSRFRPALVALLNYHDPFNWPLNRPNFGFALSAGPTYDISNGKADTSKFGVFVGATVHLWDRLFITPGLHVGEFADFPQGYSAPGQVIPPNSGTPQPVTRWTSRFAIAITFKTKDLSSVTNSMNSQSATPSSETTSSSKPKPK